MAHQMQHQMPAPAVVPPVLASPAVAAPTVTLPVQQTTQAAVPSGVFQARRVLGEVEVKCEARSVFLILVESNHVPKLS